MARVLVVGGLVALAFTVYSGVDCALTERGRLRALPRWLWLLLIVLLPVVGGVLWFLLGRGGVVARAGGRTAGPDDDPEFLRRAGSRPVEPRGDEPDWRDLERMLSLDADPDDDGEGRRR